MHDGQQVIKAQQTNWIRVMTIYPKNDTLEILLCKAECFQIQLSDKSITKSFKQFSFTVFLNVLNFYNKNNM